MSNVELDSRAKSLQNVLAPKLKCYVRVGWTRDSDGTETYMVYVDRRAAFRDQDIPGNWYGRLVVVQRIYLPGTQPPDDFLGPAW